ncbi:MAG: GHKL domain-containing protein [Clostridiales bacterium]|nr:GHKL domain-containing protein [Clostridiales bacterium]
MIAFLDVVSFVLEWAYVFVFFWIWCTFLPLRKNWPMRILALLPFSLMAVVVVFSNDLTNILYLLAGMIAYATIFHQGRWVEKTAAILIFYPALVAVNYLMQDSGLRFFMMYTGMSEGCEIDGNSPYLLASTAIHTLTLLLRLLFWIGAGIFLKKYLVQITRNLTVKMWLVVEVLMLSSFVAIFTIIYKMPDHTFVAYPICGVSIFTSFGCIYLAAYICRSVQTAYRAQELSMQQAYYEDRLRDEARVRSIYHDLKNHLLVLQSQANSPEGQESIQNLQEQVQDYENYYQTGNDFLNIILRDKARVAREKGVDFSAILHFADGSFIKPLDLSTIFGNALDNAIEASVKLPPDERLITVKGARKGNMLTIVVENNALDEGMGQSEEAKMKGETSKKEKFYHGFGLPNIRRCVESYDGQCIVKADKGKFTVKMLIPIPEEATC